MGLSALMPQSPLGTLALGKGARSDVAYSSVVLSHGGSGPVRGFTQARGASIPNLTGQTGSNATPSQVWQQKYDDHATNLTNAGFLGDGIGDAAVRAVGLDIEQAPYTNTTGVAAAYGATQKEVSDILSKCSFTFKIVNNEVTKGWFGYYPALGGETGAISTTGTAATASIVSNGVPGMGNFYDFPLMVAQGNTIEAVIATGNGSTLAFSTTSGDGQPCLVRIGLRAWFGKDILAT